MTGGCTCPIYYQEVVSAEKGSVIIRYKLPELIKNVSCGELLSCSHVSSMTGCQKRKCDNSKPITWVYQKCILGGQPLTCSHVSSMTRREPNPALPQPCFKQDKRVFVSGILPESCWCWKRKCDDSIHKKNWLSLSKKLLRRGTALLQPCFKHD